MQRLNIHNEKNVPITLPEWHSLTQYLKNDILFEDL